LTGDFRRWLVPVRAELRWANLRRVFAEHFSRSRADLQSSHGYNVVQKLAYILVVFVVFPLVLLTGLAMSPAITSAVPGLVEIFGGHQSARTLHFVFSQVLVIFFLVHIVMLARVGLVSRTLSMLMAKPVTPEASCLPVARASMAGERQADA
jgi:thiosulfate reductase cytochrome b subunit